MSEESKKYIKRHEGNGKAGHPFEAYEDTLGNWTIGYGHNCMIDPEFWDKKSKKLLIRKITPERADEIFDADYARVIADLTSPELSDFYIDKPAKVQMVLEDLCFNMGKRTLSTFGTFLFGIEQGEYDYAADRLLKTKYATQVGKRAVENADNLRSVAAEQASIAGEQEGEA